MQPFEEFAVSSGEIVASFWWWSENQISCGGVVIWFSCSFVKALSSYTNADRNSISVSSSKK